MPNILKSATDPYRTPEEEALLASKLEYWINGYTIKNSKYITYEDYINMKPKNDLKLNRLKEEIDKLDDYLSIDVHNLFLPIQVSVDQIEEEVRSLYKDELENLNDNENLFITENGVKSLLSINKEIESGELDYGLISDVNILEKKIINEIKIIFLLKKIIKYYK